MLQEEDKLQVPEEGDSKENKKELHHIIYLSSMYQNWFLDYASYVILERAVPYVNDGLKPVQRRILHAMKQMDDGRYSKVANIIGQTMMYHPHGDASIGDALVQLGQKELLIDMQGNWGNILTGDGLLHHVTLKRDYQSLPSKYCLMRKQLNGSSPMMAGTRNL